MGMSPMNSMPSGKATALAQPAISEWGCEQEVILRRSMFSPLCRQ